MDWCTYCHFFERECRHCTYSEIWQCLTVAAANSFHSALQGFLDIQNFKIVQTGTSGTRKVSIWSCISCHDRRPAHTHKQRQPPSFCHRHTFPKHFLLGSSKTHRCLALRWLCEGFFHWMIARSAHEDHIQVSSLRSARQVVDEQILIFKNAWLGWSRFASPVFFLGLSWWQL